MVRTFTRMIRGRSRQVRQMVWIGVDQVPVTITAAGKLALTSLNAAALALRPFTVIRTRLNILIRCDQLAVSQRFRGAYGRIIVSDQASAAGTASIPGPASNTDAPFFVWEPLQTELFFSDATGVNTPAGTLITVDSKAMRKVGNNEDLVSILEGSSADGVILSQIGRTLIKLH